MLRNEMLNMTSDPRFLDPSDPSDPANPIAEGGSCQFIQKLPHVSFLRSCRSLGSIPSAKWLVSFKGPSFIEKDFSVQFANESETLPGHDPRILEESNMLPVGLTNIQQTHFMNLYFSFIPCYGSYLVSTNTPAMNPNCTGPVPLQAHVSGAVPCLTVVESYKVSVRSHIRMERQSSLRFFTEVSRSQASWPQVRLVQFPLLCTPT